MQENFKINIFRFIESNGETIKDAKDICIENKRVMKDIKLVDTRKLEQIVIELLSKKGTDEGITSYVLKTVFHVIKEKFVRLINSLLSRGQYPDGWETSKIIPIPKIVKPKKASEYM